MSRATSGLVISTDNSERRFSKADISASTSSGSRGFLMILTRDDEVAGVACAVLPLPRLDPPATAGGTDFFLPLLEPGAGAVGAWRDLPSTAGGADISFTRAAFQ